MKLSLVCIGFGNVGQALVSVLGGKREFLKRSLDIEFSLHGVSEIVSGKFVCAVDEEGLDLQELLTKKRGIGSVEGCGRPGPNLVSSLDLIESVGADIVAEVTPTNMKTGEPGLSHIRLALEKKRHVVTSNKGPLILALKELLDLADRNGVKLKFGASVGGALPIVNLASNALAGCEIRMMEGILNGTTNYILTGMAEKKIEMSDALREAQHMGIAETDPTLDINGYDSAFKLLLIANLFMAAEASLSDVRIEGIGGIGLSDIEKARSENQVIKLVATARRDDNGKVALFVRPEKLHDNHPLASVGGTWKAATFYTDLLDQVTLVGGRSGPQFAAGAMLRDLVNISQELR